jgi:hypothetical protein
VLLSGFFQPIRVFSTSWRRESPNDMLPSLPDDEKIPSADSVGTPVCRKEACGFRDAYEEFARAGAVVTGVSSDPPQRRRTFAENLKQAHKTRKRKGQKPSDHGPVSAVFG